MTEDVELGMEALGRAVAGLEAFVGDPAKRQHDEQLRPKARSTKTIVVGIIAAASVAAIIGGALTKDSDLQVGLVMIGCIGAFVFGIAGLVSWGNDRSARHIQDVRKPTKAFKRFLMAVRTGRSDSAYMALVPSARTVGPVLSLDLGKIPVSDEPQQIADPPSFKKYWKHVFTGAKGQTRSAQLLKVKKLQDLPADVAIIEATIRFSSYTTLMSLFLGPLILALISRKQTKRIRKLLVRRDGQWFFVSGELSGALDQLGE